MDTAAPSLMGLFERFDIDMSRKYGEGGYGATYAAYDRQAVPGASPAAAVKIVDTKKMRASALRTECEILEQLHHPNIISIRGHGHGPPCSGQEHLYFIFMECADGGELFEQVIDCAPKAMTEETAGAYFAPLLAGVQFCHERGVAHRDLKLENVLLTKGGKLKIIDFGLSHIYSRDANGQLDRSQRLSRLVGSKSYVAPQVLSGEGYDGFEADVWSLGVCLFAMLAGFFPLSEAHPRDWRFPLLEAAQKKGDSTTRAIFGWYKRSCSYLSPAAVDLLDRMLTIDPTKRASLQDVAAHGWMHGAGKLGPASPADAVSDGKDEDLRPTFRGTALGAAAVHQLLAEEMACCDAEVAPVYRALGISVHEQLPVPAFERQFAGSIAG